MLNNSILNIRKKPCAFAKMRGSCEFPDIGGTICFYKICNGVLVSVNLHGLPSSGDICKKPIFALHIHSGSNCSGSETDPFSDALMHYNPDNCDHPYHAGDMPPVFGADGIGFSAFLTNRFSIDEIIGKTVILHSSPDDFTTQPSGNSGKKIACGVIKLSG